MGKLRKFIFWLHLGAGVVAGVIILLMSVTGILLAYQRQISAWSESRQCSPPRPDAPHLTTEALLVQVKSALGDTIPSTITWRSNPNAPVEFVLGRDRIVLVDPYTGTILGEGSAKTRAFFHQITDWHRWLGTNENGRGIGRAVTGACNLSFLFLVISGFYLWWPRKWNWSSLRTVIIFNRTLRGRARDWNRHNVAGFWSVLPLFFIVLTGVIMSYGWANNLLYRLTGNSPPPVRSGRNEDSRKVDNRGAWPTGGFDRLRARAEQQVPDWHSIAMRLPASSDTTVAFTIDSGNGGRPDKRSQLTLNSETGEIEKWEPFQKQNLGRRLRFWARFMHTGEAGGIAGQTIAALASLGAAILVWTGLAMAWRRFFAADQISAP